MATCLECGGTGIIITCCDDICVGGGECIHGDGEEICPECGGEGCVGDYDDWDDWDAYKDSHPDEFDEPTEEEEERIAREEEEYNSGICETCGGEWGEGWSTCTCEEEE